MAFAKGLNIRQQRRWTAVRQPQAQCAWHCRITTSEVLRIGLNPAARQVLDAGW